MSQRRIEAFLLRLVLEDESRDPEQWHGRIQHVASGEEQKFHTLQEALTFIRYQCEQAKERNIASEMPPFP
ncbi:MAG: hypothetical protein ACUVSY_17750 [Roseiflexus sp.]